MIDDFITKKPKPKKTVIQPVTPTKTIDDLTSHPDADEVKLDKAEEINIDLDNPEDKKTKKPKKHRRSPIKWFKDLSKLKKFLFIFTTLLVIAGSSVGAYFLTKSDPPKPVKKVEKKVVVKPKAPTTVASLLTGVQISPELNKRSITGIMIENSPDARPQSGLSVAGVVFEAIAEGGITRFLTLHQEDMPDYIGPVRSVRPYYLDWLQGFDAPVVHAGGSGDGLAKIRNEGIKDIDHGANGGAFQRVDSRYAPHNLYTSTAQLDAVKVARGYTTSTFEGFPRKTEKALKVATAKSIDLSISSYLYNAHYDYDTTTNTYKRSEGGEPHTDEKSGTQIAPKVVIANVMQFSQSGIYSVYNAIGSGKTFVFQDGGVTEGTWEKTGSKSQITFKDATGKTIKLNPGQTWITAVKSPGAIVYTP